MDDKPSVEYAAPREPATIFLPTRFSRTKHSIPEDIQVDPIQPTAPKDIRNYDARRTMAAPDRSSSLHALEKQGVYINHALEFETRYLQCQAASHYILLELGSERLKEARDIEHEAKCLTSSEAWNAARTAMEELMGMISTASESDIPSKPASATDEIWIALFSGMKSDGDKRRLVENLIELAAGNRTRYTSFLRRNGGLTVERRGKVTRRSRRGIDWATEKDTPGFKFVIRDNGSPILGRMAGDKSFRGLVRRSIGGKGSPVEYEYHNHEQRGSGMIASIKRGIIWHLAINL